MAQMARSIRANCRTAPARVGSVRLNRSAFKGVQATMSRETANRIGFWIWFFAAAVYPFYSLITDTGLYRWAVEIELTLQGSGPYEVDSRLLMTAVIVVSWGIFIAILFSAQRVIGVLRTPRTAMSDARTNAPTPAPEHAVVPARAADNKTDNAVVAIFLIVSLAAVIVGIYAGLIGYRKSSEVVSFEPLNIADGIAPRSTHVQLTGLVDPSLRIEFNDFHRSSHWETYVPVLPPHWRRGDPVIYFLHRHGWDHQYDQLLQQSEEFTIAQKGVLIRDGLPSAAAFIFKKHGIVIGAPPIVLDTQTDADLDVYFYTALLCVVIGLVFVGSIAWVWFRQRASRGRLAA